MHFLTDRKRATGLGSARSGTEHHWSMTVSSWGLLILCPLFIFTFGGILGSSREEVVAYYAQPFPAIVAALTILVAGLHFKGGVRVLIEDYTDGITRQLLIIGAICLSYAIIAAGLYGVIRLAL